VIAKLGSGASSDRLRAALRCTACGHRGALIYLPSYSMPERRQPMPLDLVPLTLRREMAKDALRSIGVELPA
jgi:hypothetical protein